AGETLRRERCLGRRRPRRAGLRRPRLVHALPTGPTPSGRARLPYLRGNRRDSQAQDRRRSAGQGIRSVQMRGITGALTGQLLLKGAPTVREPLPPPRRCPPPAPPL